jgi:transposase
MYITRVLTKRKDGSTSHTCVLLRESYWDNGKVKNRTLCNLTHINSDTIQALEAALKNPKHVLSKMKEPDANLNLKIHSSIGASYCVYQICKRLGIEKALGNTFEGKLALVQIISRVINQGSRLASVRFASENSLCEILGITKKFDEDDLYGNLEYLAKNQSKIEKKLFKTNVKNKTDDLFLYDVTSSYFEGEKNHFSEYGYNRDKKKGKKQIVLGFLCDANGMPVSVKLYPGNTNDTKTFKDQITKAQKDFGCERVTFVGDRGMIKSGQIKDLDNAGFNYITAISKPEIESLLKKDTIQIELFDKNICDVEVTEEDGKKIRYILRKNPIREKEIQNNRKSKLEALKQYCMEINTYLSEHPKSKPDKALNKIMNKSKKLKINSFLNITKEDRTISIEINNDKLTELEKLDGCYTLKTDLPKKVSAEVIHKRYKNLSKVEQAFRTSKSVLLEMRPWFVRKENSTKGHAIVVMLAYHVAKELEKLWEGENNTVKEILNKLSSITTAEVKLNDDSYVYPVMQPNDNMKNYLEKANVVLPKIITKSELNIVTKVKLQKHRKSSKTTV